MGYLDDKHCLLNGLAPDMQQAITITNDDIVSWCFNVLLGIHELTTSWLSSIKMMLSLRCSSYEINHNLLLISYLREENNIETPNA